MERYLSFRRPRFAPPCWRLFLLHSLLLSCVFLLQLLRLLLMPLLELLRSRFTGLLLRVPLVFLIVLLLELLPFPFLLGV